MRTMRVARESGGESRAGSGLEGGCDGSGMLEWRVVPGDCESRARTRKYTVAHAGMRIAAAAIAVRAFMGAGSDARAKID